MHLEANNTAAPAPALERKYKGVWLRQWGKWVAEIRLPNSRQRVWLGSYDTPEKAARAFDAAFVCLRGAGANAGVNFPESPPPAVARTRDLREVYASAVSHANRPPPLAGETAATAPVEAAAATAAAQEHDEVRENIVPPPPTPPPVQVAAPAGSFDWSQLMANSPPLYSLMAMGSHAYDDVAVWAATLAVAEFSEEDDEYEGTTSDELWNFDV